MQPTAEPRDPVMERGIFHPDEGLGGKSHVHVFQQLVLG